MGNYEASQIKDVRRGSRQDSDLSLFCVQENGAFSGLGFIIKQGQFSNLAC